MQALLKRLGIKRLIISLAVLYLLTWLITALFGPSSIENRYNSDHAFGFRDLSDKKVPSTRVYHLDVKNLLGDSPRPAAYPWHYISPPRAVCPFVLVSDFGYVFAAMGGGGGRVWSFWFFGWQMPIYTESYWAV